jgi:chaperonin GroEL
MVELGFHPLEVKKGIDMASKKLLEFFEEIKIEIKNKRELFNLAMITTNHNEEISKIVSEGLISVGPKGIIQIEESPTGNTEIKVKKEYIKHI